MLLELSVFIDRPVEQVFTYICELDRQDHGDRVLLIEKTTPGPARVGTKYRENVKMPFGRSGEIWLEITAMQAPHDLSIRFEGPVMHGEIKYTMTATREGIEVHQLEQLSYTGWARPANVLGRGALHRKVRRRLDGFKNHLETRHAGDVR